MFHWEPCTVKTLNCFVRWMYGQSIIDVECPVKSTLDLETLETTDIVAVHPSNPADHAIKYFWDIFQDRQLLSNHGASAVIDGTFRESLSILRKLKSYRPIGMDCPSFKQNVPSTHSQTWIVRRYKHGQIEHPPLLWSIREYNSNLII